MWATIGWVLAAIVIAVVVLVVLAFLLLWVVRRSVDRKIKQAQASAEAQQSEPARVTMVLEKLNFSDPQVQAAMQQFKALSYVSAGRYRVPEKPDLKIWAGTQPQDGSLALVLESDNTYFAADVLRFYEGGSMVGAGTNPVHDPERYPAHWQYQQFPRKAAMQDMVQWLAAQPLQAAVVPATAQSLCGLHTQAYADLVDYQASLPVPSLAEWKESLGKSLGSSLNMSLSALTDQQWQALYDMQWWGAELTAEDAMRDHVLQSGVVPAQDWDRIHKELVFVHSRLSADAVAQRALRHSAWTIEEPAVNALLQKNLDNQALFDAIQSLLPAQERWRYVTPIRKPLDAHVYQPAVFL